MSVRRRTPHPFALLTGSFALVLVSKMDAAVAEPLPAVPSTSESALPGEESGRIDRRDEGISTGRAIGRGVLFVPRLVIDLAFAPIRGAVWVYDRYQVRERWIRIFFNDANTMGLYPVAQFDSGFGLNAGGRFVHRDLFGEGEHLSARAGTGGRYRTRFATEVRTGDRFGKHLALELGGEFERRPRDAFYGIGNDGLGLAARHRQQLERVTAAVDLRLVERLHLRAAGAFSDLTYGASDSGTSIEMVYDTSTLQGFDGVRNAYGELELRWDRRGQASVWDAPALFSSGWLAAAFAGRDHQLGAAGDYWRYGFDLQHFLSLGAGPRVLVTRLRGEAVTGNEASFTELPQLGGKMLLRGYPADRFRDRVAALGSLEYQWDLNRHSMASLFVDVGRVYHSVSDLSVADVRIGYGIGVQLHSTRSFVAGASLATSKDGGVFLNLAFDPVFEIPPREGRR